MCLWRKKIFFFSPRTCAASFDYFSIMSADNYTPMNYVAFGGCYKQWRINVAVQYPDDTTILPDLIYLQACMKPMTVRPLRLSTRNGSFVVEFQVDAELHNIRKRYSSSNVLGKTWVPCMRVVTPQEADELMAKEKIVIRRFYVERG